jgi:hypothetical protein
MVGLIEGVGEATASISKLFSGWISDRLGKRKALAVLGYGLGALSKPLFALASTSSLVLAARFSDRVGKGIRGAPRDAMIGDMAGVESSRRFVDTENPTGRANMRYGSRHENDAYRSEGMFPVAPAFEAPAEIRVEHRDHDHDSDHIAEYGIPSANVGHERKDSLEETRTPALDFFCAPHGDVPNEAVVGHSLFLAFKPNDRLTKTRDRSANPAS